MVMLLALLGLAGALMLYFANATKDLQVGLAMTGYYFLAFMFGASPVIYSWAIANVGGTTKKSTMLSFMNCTSLSSLFMCRPRVIAVADGQVPQPQASSPVPSSSKAKTHPATCPVSAPS